jgi:hypothetical protein
MKLRISGVFATSVFVMLVCSLCPLAAQAQFTQQGPKLVGTSYAAGPTPLQGISVSVSADGNTAIVGGSGDNNSAGAAWVFARAGGAWSQQAKLVGTGAVGPYPAQQGFSVAVSGDGNTVTVGGRADNNFIGAAWVFTRSNGVWTQDAKLIGADVLGPFAEQGFSVSLSDNGNTAIVGGRDDNNFIGAAWVFTRSNGVWAQETKLIATGVIGTFGYQGNSVSLSADGNTALVGGNKDNDEIGAAWIFTRSNGVWSQEAKLVGTGATGRQEQGYFVSIAADGNTAISAGPFAGASWVFTRSNGLWSQEAELVAAGPVALSGEGNIAIVGGDSQSSVGGALVFTRSNSAWSETAELVGTDAIGNANQGSSVFLSGDGNTAIVGGDLDNNGIGAAWVYAQPLFAGTPGKANCYGQSVSALVQQFGGLNAAAAASGFSGVGALQNAILAFCGG